MARGRVPRGEDVLRLLRREAAEGRYAYAPGRLSFEGIYAQLAIEGVARAPATESALRQALGRLVAEGKVRAVDVAGPDGGPGGDWYEAVGQAPEP
jgi:hypothetical protein